MLSASNAEGVAPQNRPGEHHAGLTSTTLGGSTFTLASKYRPQRLVGSGSGGVVVAATCGDTSGEVAIKKIHIERDLTIERHALAARRTLREISLISQLDHENVLGLLDLSCSGGGAADFDHLYLVTPLMDADLHRVIRSPQPLTEQHVQFFMWQLLRGLEHLHACAVVHRDLKPANLLVNANCDLKITDFGLARVIGGPAEEAPRDGLTSYVVTRWYRAPEVLVGAEYGRAVDVWSAGCILAEMLGRAPLFPGRDALEQLRLILRVAATLPGGSAERDHVPAAAVSVSRFTYADTSFHLPPETPGDNRPLHRLCGLADFQRSACHGLLPCVHRPEVVRRSSLRARHASRVCSAQPVRPQHSRRNQVHV